MQYLFRILFFVVFSTVRPEPVRSEMLRPATENQAVKTFGTFFHPSQLEKEVTGSWQKQLVEKQRRFFEKGQKDGRSRTITAIVFLALGVVIFGLFGLAFLLGGIEGWYFFGAGFATALIVFSLLLLFMCIFSIEILIRKIKKLRGNQGELLPIDQTKELPRRPPSRKMKKQ